MRKEVSEFRVPYEQPEYRLKWEDRELPICRSCFVGIHPHKLDDGEVHPMGSEYDEYDCKVLLTDSNGKRNGKQCCCPEGIASIQRRLYG